MSYKRHQRLQAPQLPQLPYEIWFRMINDLIQELFDGLRLGAGCHDEYGLKNSLVYLRLFDCAVQGVLEDLIAKETRSRLLGS